MWEIINPASATLLDLWEKPDQRFQEAKGSLATRQKLLGYQERQLGHQAEATWLPREAAGPPGRNYLATKRGSWAARQKLLGYQERQLGHQAEATWLPREAAGPPDTSYLATKRGSWASSREVWKLMAAQKWPSWAERAASRLTLRLNMVLSGLSVILSIFIIIILY